MRHLWGVALGIVLGLWAARQCRKPSGPLGRAYLWAMNRSHSSLTDWGLQYVPLREDDVILDVGCGGGRTVEKLAKAARCYQSIGRPSRKKPPEGPSGPSVAAQTIPAAPSATLRGALEPPMSVRTQPGQTLLTRTR